MSKSRLLAGALDGSRVWTRKLIADLDGDAWFYQPSPGAQHVLWICGHLAVASDLLVTVRCCQRAALVSEAFSSHFPIGADVKSADDHSFPSPAVVCDEMDRVHGAVLEQIRALSDSQLSAPALGAGGAVHPHYATVEGAIVHAARHESFHAGQIAMLRRLMGKRFLR